MGLINNGYRVAASPFRSYIGVAGTLNGAVAFRNANLTGRQRGISMNTSRQVALPMGNLAPHAWMLPQTGGGMSLRARGEGAFSAGLIPTYPMTLDLTGAGDLQATAGLIISMLLAMTGAGDLSANIEGRLNASVDFTGSGDLTADLSGFANLLIDMLGSGDLDATIAAYGNMEIDIVVTGTGLSTANVGQAVWAALAAANNEPGSMGALLNTGAGGLTAAQVWEYATRTLTASGLTSEQATQLLEIFQRLGLDSAKPLVQTATEISTPDWTLNVTEGSGTVTVTREP